jgi:transposase-like protein
MREEILREISVVHRSYPKKQARRYSDELKRKIVLFTRSKGIGIQEASELFDISATALSVWSNNGLELKEIKEEGRLFNRIKIIPDNEISSSIEIISPSGYVIRGLGATEAVKILRGLHA